MVGFGCISFWFFCEFVIVIFIVEEDFVIVEFNGSFGFCIFFRIENVFDIFEFNVCGNESGCYECQ